VNGLANQWQVNDFRRGDFISGAIQRFQKIDRCFIKGSAEEYQITFPAPPENFLMPFPRGADLPVQIV